MNERLVTLKLLLAVFLFAAPSAIAPVSENNPYAAAGVDDPAAFERMFAALQAAVASGDKAGASKLVLYPLRLNGGKKPLSIENAREFMTMYDRVFTDNVKKALTAQKPREMFVNAQGVMVGDGQIWLGASAGSPQRYGMIAVNP